jgi:class 3 adenylate cyclase
METDPAPEVPPQTSAEPAARLGAIFLLGGGFLTLIVASIAWRIPERLSWNPLGVGISGAAAMAVGAFYWVLRGRVKWWTIHLFLATAPVFVAVVTILWVGAPNFAPLFFLWPILVAFAFVPRRLAIAHAAWGLAVLASIFLLQPGWEPAILYWTFVAGTIVVTAVTVTGLVNRAEEHARREQEAREELAGLNRDLERRVEEQVQEMSRLERLRRFLSPSVADAVLSAEGEEWLAPHRREIAVFFCDLRGFTAFSATAEPEDVTRLLERFHGILGVLVERYEATVGGFAGDGVFLYFNDPVPCPDPAERAVNLAIDLIAPMRDLALEWRSRGFDISYGVGISLGHATMGLTGFESRREYTALGRVVNLASRLSDEAGPADVLLDQRAWAAVQDTFATESAGQLRLKGFAAEVPTFRLVPEAGTRPRDLAPPQAEPGQGVART